MESNERTKAKIMQKVDIRTVSFVVIASLLVAGVVWMPTGRNIDRNFDTEELIVETVQRGSIGGSEAMKDDVVLVHYVARTREGAEVDNTYDKDKPFRFQLGSNAVIDAWNEGVEGMKEGEVRILISPPHMAYGVAGDGTRIPPNTPLEYEIELLEVFEG